MAETLPLADPADLKSCCADLYQTDMARVLLGDSFHPGGLALTRRLGELLELAPGMHVVDVAAGRGTSAIELAKKFGVQVTGVDYGGQNVAAATAAAEDAGVGQLVRFVEGDAESLDLLDGSADAVICECAFCTFPTKAVAAAEFARVLKPGGRAGISDLTRNGPLPAELNTLLAWIACIADALPVAEYEDYLRDAGLRVATVEPHDRVLTEMIAGIKTKLVGAQLLSKLGKLQLGDIDWAQAKGMAKSADQAVKDGVLGYAVLIAAKPSGRR